MNEAKALEEIDDRNVINMVSKKLRETVIDIYQRHPEWQTTSELELRDMLMPSLMADRMRISFWEEYQRAQDRGVHMMMSKVYDPFMTLQTFYGNFIKKDSNVAWMISPPSEHFLSMKADLYQGKDELGKVLRMKLFDENGDLKIEQAKVFIKVFEIYSNRIYGSAIQRIEQKTANINLSDLEGDPDELRKELEARKKERGVIDMSASDET